MNAKTFQLLLADILYGKSERIEFEPTSDAPPGTDFLGVVNDPVSRSLWSFKRRMERDYNDYVTINSLSSIAGVKGHTIGQLETHTMTVAELHFRVVTIGHLFWDRVNEEIPFVNADVYKGWKIFGRVSFDGTPLVFPIKLLKLL